MKIFLKEISSSVNNYKYWVATSYVIPTKKILEFFKKSYEKRFTKNQAHIRPVKAPFLVIPGVLLLSVAHILALGKTFKLASMIVFLLFGFQNGETRAVDSYLWEKA